ncbi:MAG: PKD domain-containing protein [Tenuifilaceae bacterium]|jgi:PKD repeat protein|nr:PKD domain-containing protein [Tenuifilaceae bacterium]
MKTKTSSFFRRTFMLLGAFALITFISCKEDELVPDPIASFQFEVSTENWKEVTFTNYSQNAESYSWNFGDNETSTDENPTHIFAEAGNYTVTLTATNKDNVSKEFSETITITDPYQALRLLVGESSKSWRLLREGPALGIGPGLNETTGEYDYTSWWFLENDGARPCVFNHTWTFNQNGTVTFDHGGLMWGEDHVFDGKDVFGTCFEATAANMVNKNGVDVSAWLSPSHTFEYNPTTGKLTLTGEGAWMGLLKVSPGGYIAVPGQSIEYDVIITEEEGYDLMKVSVWMAGDSHYWQFNYVSYTTGTEPDVVSFMVDFNYTVEGRTVTFENLSKDATSYSWDFGDGNTSTEENPVHTYAADGKYTVVLTGTGATGTKEKTKDVIIDTNTPTELAPNPTEPEANVISIYGETYTNISGVNLDPDWGQATVTGEVDIAGGKVLKMAGLTYQGIDWANTPQDVSGKTKLHVDVWCAAVTDVNISVIGDGENPVKITTEAGVWKSFDILLSDYTVPNLAAVIQIKFDDAGSGETPTIYVDNIYFY